MLEDIKRTLWATADKLRANMDAAEYKHLVLGLIFVKDISDTFQAKRTELTARFAEPADDYFLADSTPELLTAELDDRDYYREVNVDGSTSHQREYRTLAVHAKMLSAPLEQQVRIDTALKRDAGDRLAGPQAALDQLALERRTVFAPAALGLCGLLGHGVH